MRKVPRRETGLVTRYSRDMSRETVDMAKITKPMNINILWN